MFLLFKSRRPKQRCVKDTIIPDIITIGFCLTNGTPSKELDKVLSKQSDDSQGNDDVAVSNMSALIQKVQKLSSDLKKIKSDFETIQNKQMKKDLRQLRSDRHVNYVVTESTNQQTSEAGLTGTSAEDTGNVVLDTPNEDTDAVRDILVSSDNSSKSGSDS